MTCNMFVTINVENTKCDTKHAMYYVLFYCTNLCKLGIILDGTYLLLNLPNIHYAQLFIRLKRIK